MKWNFIDSSTGKSWFSEGFVNKTTIALTTNTQLSILSWHLNYTQAEKSIKINETAERN